MTIRMVIEAADAMRGNRLSAAFKIKCLSELDWQIFEDIIRRHEGNAQETFTPHESDTAVLLAPESFAPMYEAYLCARVDAAQGETALYDADRKRFEAQYARFAAWYNETHLPKRNAAIRVSEPFERR